MLRDLIRNELLNDKLYELSSDVIESISKDVTETLIWCLSRGDVDTCSEFRKIVNSFIATYPLLRALKYLSDETIHDATDTIDKHILAKLLRIIKRYFEAIIKGVMMHDGTVPVIVEKELILNGRIIPKGAFTLLNANEAFILEAASYVRVLIPP